MRTFRVFSGTIFVAIVLLAIGSWRAEAATFRVTSVADSGVGSLRQAILDANATAAADTIVFALPAGAHSIDLTTVGDVRDGDASAFVLTGTVSIVGPGADLLTVRRSAAAGTVDFRLFFVNGAASISGLTLSNGHCSFNSSTNAAFSGGAFTNAGSLSLVDCVVSGNSSVVLASNTQAGGTGGGIFNYGTLNLTRCLVADNKTNLTGGGLDNAGGVVTLVDSTFSGNECKSDDFSLGGGLINVGSVSMSNCTFVGNRSVRGDDGSRMTFHYGGGFYNSQGTATVDSCTFTGNSVVSNAGAVGGGIVNGGSGTLILNNSILAGNMVAGGTANSGADLNGAMSSGDYNLVQETRGATLKGTHNVIGVDAKFGPLQANGGMTPCLEPMVGSAAIDAGSTALTLDQRGVLRPQGGTDDIGAVERDATKPTVAFSTPAEGASLAISGFKSTTITGSARDNAGVSAVRFTLSRSRNGVLQFWNGSSFTATSLSLAATLSGSGPIVNWGLGSLAPPMGQLDAGAYRVDAYALDADGNKSSTAILTFNLVSVGADSSSPVVSVSSPMVNQKILLADFGASSISGGATDNIGVSVVKVKLSRKRGDINYYWNGFEFGTAIATVDVSVVGTTNVTWSLGSKRPSAGQLDVGAYQVEVQAFDLVGNASGKVAVPFVLGTDFTAPGVSVSSPTQNQVVSINGFGPIQGLASDNLGVVAVKVRVQHTQVNYPVYWNGFAFEHTVTPTTVDAQVSVVGGKSVSWTIGTIPARALEPGTYTIYASGYDAAGNVTTTAARTVTVVFGAASGVSGALG